MSLVARDKPSMKEVAQLAQDAFWQEVIKHLPSPYGDFPPEDDFAFTSACEEAVRVWRMWNPPSEEGGG